MTDEAALLKAIAENPGEDTPRLVYADWLDEHDRPTEAELIRVQCAIAGLDHSSVAVRNQNVHLWKRQQDLLEFQRGELLGPLADAVGPLDAVFDRGFLTELTLDAATFLKHSDAVASLRPRPEIRVTGAAKHLAELVDSPNASVINRLELEDADWSLPEDVDVSTFPLFFMTIANHWQLRELSLASSRITDEVVAMLVNADDASWPLTELDLSDNEISDEGVRTLAESSLFPRLRKLILGGNPISNEAARMLAEAPGRLEYLNVRFTGIGRTGQQVLLRRKGTKIDLF